MGHDARLPPLFEVLVEHPLAVYRFLLQRQLRGEQIGEIGDNPLGQVVRGHLTEDGEFGDGRGDVWGSDGTSVRFDKGSIGFG